MHGGGVAKRGSVGALIALILTSSMAAGPVANAVTQTGRTKMLALVNHDREQRDRTALSLDECLSRYAKRHSRRMENRGHLFHTADLAAVLDGRDWSLGGENVGVGESPDSVEAGFMRNKEHRKNILRRRFDHAAIGVVHEDGLVWVTVIFYG